MTKLHLVFITLSLLVLTACGTSKTQKHPAETTASPIYQNQEATFQARAADLVSRMTLEEKIAQTLNDAPAIPRLGVPKYNWWNEALHGVARAGQATVFPQAIGMAATFDENLLFDVAEVISTEGRAKYHEAIRFDQRARYQGLTFWSPNVNIFRDPRWGRGQETYGEDPFLTSRLGIAFVKGLQGDDPKYRKTDAMAKHFAVHNGPEADRHHFDVHPSKRDLWDTYLPAFEALVKEGNVAAVMSAYNRVYGEPAPSSRFLLQDILRDKWGFEGYVVSDCWAVKDIWANHKVVETPAEAAAIALRNGTELNCGNTYPALREAVEEGLITEAEITKAVEMLFVTRFRLGMFDDANKVPWADTPASLNQAPEHDELARKTAENSMVLLKNTGVLPLSKNIKKIAVIGPTANSVPALLGNYHGTPANPTTLLEGIKKAVSQNTQVLYAKGSDLVEGRSDVRSAPTIASEYLRPSLDSNQRGLKAEYFSNAEFAGEPVLTRIDSEVDKVWEFGGSLDELIVRGELNQAVAPGADDYSVRWTGYLLPPVTGEYQIGISGDDQASLFVNDKLVASVPLADGRTRSTQVTMTLQAGQAYKLRMDYVELKRRAHSRLSWRMPNAKDPVTEALDVAKQSDVVIFIGGLTAELEGEEMKVSYPGFSGGDRTDIRLPEAQRRLLMSLHATGKPIVLVLTTGSALAVDWAQENVPAILLAWYPGQRGGEALANVLFGDVNPAGRLPVTFYKSSEKLPPFEDYNMDNRTYRYFKGDALYPFGYGLSYTQFQYGDLKVSSERVSPNTDIVVTSTVKNIGQRAGDEVLQLYVAPKDTSNGRALKELRGVQRVHLKPGEQKDVQFVLSPSKHFRRFDERQESYVVDAGQYILQVGASSDDVRVQKAVEINSSLLVLSSPH